MACFSPESSQKTYLRRSCHFIQTLNAVEKQTQLGQIKKPPRFYYRDGFFYVMKLSDYSIRPVQLMRAPAAPLGWEVKSSVPWCTITPLPIMFFVESSQPMHH